MKEIASWSGHIKNLRAFPPPNAENYISYANVVFSTIDKLHTIGAPSYNELGDIHQLQMQTRELLRRGDEDSCYPLWKQMTHAMNQLNNRIEDWLNIQRVI